jgi:hypothetical protein
MWESGSVLEISSEPAQLRAREFAKPRFNLKVSKMSLA